MKRLPPHWNTASAEVREPTALDTDSLVAAFNELSGLASVERAFGHVDREEMVNLLQESAAGANGLQLQAVYEDQELVGNFHVLHEFRGTPTLFASMFFLRPGRQGRALGTEIAKALLRLARALGYHRAWLKVSLLNWPAIRFWTKLGFRHVVDVTGDTAFDVGKSASLVLERQLSAEHQ